MKSLMPISILFTLSFVVSANDARAPQWKWDNTQSSLLWCVYNQITYSREPELTCEIVTQRKTDSMNPFRVRILSNGEECCAFDAHPNTVFIRKDHKLYVADFRHISTGCSVIAFDLKQRKQIWKTHLQGLGPIAHWKYSNFVNIQLENGHIVLYGKESEGRYIEMLHEATGKTIANTRLPTEK